MTSLTESRLIPAHGGQQFEVTFKQVAVAFRIERREPKKNGLLFMKNAVNYNSCIVGVFTVSLVLVLYMLVSLWTTCYVVVLFKEKVSEWFLLLSVI